jgi:uncharacterized LabA/DUF88 family protein
MEVRMPAHVGFVDWGFLHKSGAKAMGEDPRSVRPNARGCVGYMAHPSFFNTHSNLLRVYWYDGRFDERMPQYRTQRKLFDGIASVPGIQLRLGHVQISKPSWQYALKQALRASGVDMTEFTKHFQFRSEATQKGVDTLMALDLVRLAQRQAYDTAILVTGDRDLAEPVRVA